MCDVQSGLGAWGGRTSTVGTGMRSNGVVSRRGAMQSPVAASVVQSSKSMILYCACIHHRQQVCAGYHGVLLKQ